MIYVLLNLLYPSSLSSPSPSLHYRPNTARILEVYIFGCVSVRSVELLMQIL